MERKKETYCAPEAETLGVEVQDIVCTSPARMLKNYEWYEYEEE